MKFNARKAQWENEKNSVAKLVRLREQIEEINSQIEMPSRSTIWRRPPSCSTANCPDCRNSWRSRRKPSRTRIFPGP